MSELRLPTGTALDGGRYLVESVLGEGGFGITYLCREPSLARQVAVKEYFPVGCERGEGTILAGRLAEQELHGGLRRFEKEARCLAGLDHPNIVRVAGLFRERGTFYLVTEYVAGEVLAAHHQDWLEPIVSALQAVHARGLIHGDIKPENILIQPHGRPVLIDFGCSRESHSQPTSTIVSHGFSPPEQYLGKALTPASDQYALAATCYCLSQGEPPPTAFERLAGQPLPEMAPALSRALAIEPGLRWPDLNSFLSALRQPSSGLLEIPKAGGWVRALAVSGHWIASGGEDRQVRLWSTLTGQQIALGQHEGWVTGLIFRGDQLYSVATDRWLYQWDTTEGKLVDKLKLPGIPQCLAGDQERLFVGDDKGQIYRIDAMQLTSSWLAAPAAVSAICLNQNMLACAGDLDRVALWDWTSQTLVERLKGHRAPVRALCWFSDCLYSGGQDRRLLRWDWREGTSTEVTNSQGTIWCLAADIRGVVSGGGDKLVRTSDGVLGQHGGEVRCLALGPDWVAAAGQDGQVRLHPWVVPSHGRLRRHDP
ncbi:MAG: serine/threonine-protein kinase [Vulcanimicrobiota bacterium]